MDDRYLCTQQPDAASRGSHREIADCAGLEVADHVLFGVGLAKFIVLNVVVGEDAREFGEVGGDQGAVAVFEEFQDLLLVGY